MDTNRETIKRLTVIPGVGKSIASDLISIGVTSVEQLRGRDPQVMYDQLCELAGVRIDRCLLYVLRCAVYYATESAHDPELLKWWNWKNREL